MDSRLCSLFQQLALVARSSFRHNRMMVLEEDVLTTWEEPQTESNDDQLISSHEFDVLDVTGCDNPRQKDVGQRTSPQ